MLFCGLSLKTRLRIVVLYNQGLIGSTGLAPVRRAPGFPWALLSPWTWGHPAELVLQLVDSAASLPACWFLTHVCPNFQGPYCNLLLFFSQGCCHTLGCLPPLFPFVCELNCVSPKFVCCRSNPEWVLIWRQGHDRGNDAKWVPMVGSDPR